MGDVAAHVDQRYRSDCSDWRPLAWMIAGYDLDVEGTPLPVASPSATTALVPNLKRAECLRDPEMDDLGAFSRILVTQPGRSESALCNGMTSRGLTICVLGYIRA